MDEEIDRLVIGVRADTAGFSRDVATLKAGLEQGLGSGAERAGRSIEGALGKAVRTGKLGFDDLGAAALRALDQIAGAAVRAGVASAGGSLGGGAGLTGLATTLLTSVLGLPGRATGGPVSPGAAYLVGERGPELFVPTASGAIATMMPAAGSPAAESRAAVAMATPRDVRVAISINAPAGIAPRSLAQSGRQVARAVARAIEQAEG